MANPLSAVPTDPPHGWPQVAPSANGSAAPGTHQVQAAAEGVHLPAEVVDDGRRVEFLDAKFRIAEKIGLMPLLAFANAAKQGLDSADMEALATMYGLIRDCIDQTRPQREVTDPATGEPTLVNDGPSEWDRFERHAIDRKADGDDLFKVVQSVIEILSARPQSPPGTSSAGRGATSPNLKGFSSSPATNHPELVSVDSLLAHSTP